MIQSENVSRSALFVNPPAENLWPRGVGPVSVFIHPNQHLRTPPKDELPMSPQVRILTRSGESPSRIRFWYRGVRPESSASP